MASQSEPRTRILVEGKGAANMLASQLITCGEDELTVRLVEQAV